MDVTKEMIESYTAKLRAHISFVQEAGRKLGISESQLEKHDASKWDAEEFIPYVRRFEAGVNDRQEFGRAWIHHIHHNPHHPQHWMVPDRKDWVVKMPENYCLEMIADWMGSNRTYLDSWDMSDWLKKNFRNIVLHPESKEFVERALLLLGYEDF